MSTMCASPTKLIITPHGTMSTRKLVSMKIVDKYSCYVAGLSQDIADPKILSQIEYFGQFGDIASIRVIRHKNPIEAYIRFESELSAIQAIKWCHVKKQFEANHGFKRYCLRFINGKPCKKKACSNKHEWCDENDIIIIKNKQYKAFEADGNNNNKYGDNIKNNVDELSKDEQINILQQQFMYLQYQYGQQNELVASLIHQIQGLKAENNKIRSTNDQLMAVLNTNINMNDFPDHDHYDDNNTNFEQSVYHIVDAVINNEVDSSSNTSSSSEYVL